jgi:hypothetical protein
MGEELRSCKEVGYHRDVGKRGTLGAGYARHMPHRGASPQ